MKIDTDIIRHIYSEDGNFLTVRPWPESPESVVLMSEGKENEEYFGRIETAMNLEFARQLGQSLIACADEIQRKL